MSHQSKNRTLWLPLLGNALAVLAMLFHRELERFEPLRLTSHINALSMLVGLTFAMVIGGLVIAIWSKADITVPIMLVIVWIVIGFIPAFSSPVVMGG